MAKFKCTLPWNHIATQVNGDTRLCCISTLSKSVSLGDYKAKNNLEKPKLGHQKISDIMNSEFKKNIRNQMDRGEVPASCKVCHHLELHSGSSKRIHENKVWPQLESPELQYIDLRLGQACNLRCITCSSRESSAWRTEGPELLKNAKNPELKKKLNWAHNPEDIAKDYSRWYDIESAFWPDFFNHLSTIKSIYFAGGEPLIQREHRWCLEEIISRGHAGQISLRYNTNFTIYDESLHDLWGNFKQVILSISLDGIESQNEYIRFPSKWQVVEDNLERLNQHQDPKISVGFTYTVQALNMGEIAKFYSWLEVRNFYFSKAEKLGDHIHLNLLHAPNYLNIRVLSAVYKAQLTDMYSRKRKIQILGQIEAILGHMNSEDWTHLTPQLYEYLHLLDNRRDLSVAQVFPEFTEQLKRVFYAL